MKYWIILKNSLQSNLAYRFNFFAGFFSEGLELIIFAYIWYSIYQSGGMMGQYSLQAIVSYYVISVIIRLFLDSGGTAWLIGDEIREGRISGYLVKPISYFGVYFAKSLGQSISRLVIYLPMFILFALIIPIIKISWLMAIVFAVSLIFAILIDFIISYLIGISTFYFGFVQGLNFTMGNISLFLSGSLIPIDLLPDFWQNIANLLPFKYIIYLPNKIINGRISSSDIFYELMIGAVWLFALLIISFFLYKKGLKRFEGEGI